MMLGEIKSKLKFEKEEKSLNKCELNFINVDNTKSNLNTFGILSTIANKCVSCIKIKMDDVM